MAKYITSNQICETFDIIKMTLWRWETMTPWGVPFPAPAFPATRGSVKRYLIKDVNAWVKKCNPPKATA